MNYEHEQPPTMPNRTSASREVALEGLHGALERCNARGVGRQRRNVLLDHGLERRDELVVRFDLLLFVIDTIEDNDHERSNEIHERTCFNDATLSSRCAISSSRPSMRVIDASLFVVSGGGIFVLLLRLRL
jgi:hypothetical protein